MTTSPRLWTCLWFALVLPACALGVVDDSDPAGTSDDDADSLHSLSFEDDALRDALDTSRTLDAPISFRRLSMVWESDDLSRLEVSVSTDGREWSRWLAPTSIHSEHELGFATTAEVDLESASRHIRLRSIDAVLPSSLIVRFSPRAAGEFLERGDEGARPGESPFRAAQIPLSVPVNSRESWGAKARRCASSHSPRRITIHHTESSNVSKLSVQAQLRSIQSYHQGTRGWCDIGYHYLISRDGRIWQGRPPNLLGSHAGGANTGNLGIALIGSYDDNTPPAAQLDAAAALVRALTDAHGIPLDSGNVKGHRDHKSTSCPGARLYSLLSNVIAQAQGTTTLPPQNPPSSDSVRLRGVVFDSATDSPVAGASVSLSPSGRTATTDAAGMYEIDNLERGFYTVAAAAVGYAERRIERTFDDADSWGSVGIAATGMTSGTAGLQGVVYFGGDGDNRVPSATVDIAGQSVALSASGYFKVTGLAPGTYTVRARDSVRGEGIAVRSTDNGTVAWASIELSPTAGGSTGGAPSCSGQCGNAAPVPGSSPACHCDDLCTEYGDCCGDYADVCVAAPPPAPGGGSCAQHCGQTAPAPGSSPLCYCDPDCSAFGDCCQDYADTCQ
jgi:hypothetical protein